MPKRPRQAHIPQQSKKRKVRRNPLFTAADPYLAPEENVVPFRDRQPVAEPLPAETTSRRAEGRLVVVRTAGQLPTFERAYLVNELRQIAFTAAGLLAFIIVLTIVLR